MDRHAASSRMDRGAEGAQAEWLRGSVNRRVAHVPSNDKEAVESL